MRQAGWRLRLVGGLMDNTRAPVGRVLGTEDPTPLEFWVSVAEGGHLQLDDVVTVYRQLPLGEEITHYGAVGRVRLSADTDLTADSYD